MRKTRQEERLEELEKNETTLTKNHETLEKNHEALSAKIYGLYSKFDEMQTTLKQLFQGAGQKSTVTSISHDFSSASTVKSNVTGQQLPRETSHDDNLCVVRQVEMPSFNGEDPLGWLARAEQYFSLQRTHPDKKVKIAFMTMEGDALHWLQWFQQQYQSLTWLEFKTKLMEQFGGDITASPFEQLAGLHQTSSVDEFVHEFLARAAQIPFLDSHLQLGLFLNGLKEEIGVKFRPNDTGELRTAMRVARSIEKELDFYYGVKSKPLDKAFRRFKDSYGTPNQSLRTLDHWKPAALTHISSNVGSSNSIYRPRGTRQYSHQEYLDMKARGLCFRCKQPYSPQHDCPYKSLRALMLAEDETIIDGEIMAMEGHVTY